MNKRAYIFYLTIFIIGFGIAYICGLTAGMENKTVYHGTEANVTPDSDSPTEEGYWVKAVNNVIFVYKSCLLYTSICHPSVDISGLRRAVQKIKIYSIRKLN